MARAAVKDRKVKGPKAKQLGFSGFVPKEIADVKDACEAYDEIVQERMALTQKEVKAGDEVLRRMEKNKIGEYRVGNTIFRVAEGKRKVKRVRVTEEEIVEASENDKPEVDLKKAAGGDLD